MQTEAIAKLKTEIDGIKNNPYVKVVGQFLISHIESNPQDASCILTADKTITKSLEAMKTEAKKKQHNGMSILTDQEGFGIVLKYFGITRIPVVASSSPTVCVPSHVLPSASSFDVKLDDFL